MNPNGKGKHKLDKLLRILQRARTFLHLSDPKGASKGDLEHNTINQDLPRNTIEVTPPKRASLLGLPAELRNRIYLQVGLDALHAHIHAQHPPDMLRVSRQVREDFKAIYYSSAVMTFEVLISRKRSLWRSTQDPKILAALLFGKWATTHEAWCGLLDTARSLARGTARERPVASASDFRVQQARATVDTGKKHVYAGVLVFAEASGEPCIEISQRHLWESDYECVRREKYRMEHRTDWGRRWLVESFRAVKTACGAPDWGGRRWKQRQRARQWLRSAVSMAETDSELDLYR